MFQKTMFLGWVWVVLAMNAYAQQTPDVSAYLAAANPSDIFPHQTVSQFEVRDKFKENTPSIITVVPGASGPIVRAEAPVAGKSYYDVQAIWKSNAGVKKGDVLLARFSVRSVYAKQESGEAVVYFFVQNASAPSVRSVSADVSVGPEWKTFQVPFRAAVDMDAGEAGICFAFGALAQKVEISGLQVLNFEQKISLDSLPITRFTYKGREQSAAWRAGALQRIEEIRTAPFTIKVTDDKGKPVSGASIHISMIQSQFIWGTAVNEALLAKEPADSNATNYRKVLKELFNTTTIENGFKSERWGNSGRRAETLKAFEWLQANQLRQRGHNLVWPAWKFNREVYKATAEKDTAAFRKMIEADIRDRMAVTKGKVIAWDVINEMIHEKEFLPYLPKDAPVQWFKLAKILDPKAQLFINEYGMLNSIASQKNIEEYIQQIKDLQNAGASIEGIGVQGHVGRQPRSPADVIKDLDLFTPLGIPVQITEFDVNSPDEELQADYTRDFLIACYSHPIITGFTKWGFWQGAHWKPDAAMFRSDWTPKPNAAVWREWVAKQWKTNIEATSDGNGTVDGRGHLGRYEIKVSKGNKNFTQVYQLTKNSGPLTVTLK